MPHGGKFQTIQEIQLVCTSVIFTCTAQHAATNFSMYDEYAFCPNYPAKLEGDPPIDKVSTCMLTQVVNSDIYNVFIDTFCSFLKCVLLVDPSPGQSHFFTFPQDKNQPFLTSYC